MRHRIPIPGTAGLLAAMLLAPTPVQAQRDRDDDPTYLRELVVEIDPETVRGWANAGNGDEIVLPWFDESVMVATTDRVEKAGDFVNVFGTFPDEMMGSLVLTIGNDALVGAVNLGGTTHRLRDLDGDAYLLAQVDGRQYTQDQPDTSNSEEIHSRQPKFPRKRGSAASVSKLPLRVLTKILKVGALGSPNLKKILDDGSTIDLLVAYTGEAANWADTNGVDLPTEITNMVADANQSFDLSGIQPRLRLVGTTEVKYSVVDEEMLKVDLERLRDGVGDLDQLHVLRDLYRADLVSLLVLNGADSCSAAEKRACGRAMVPRRFPFLGEEPRSSTWDGSFENKGFSVAHLPAAINYQTFKHEIGHNLGAHHDFFTFVTTVPLPDPTADLLARGWVLWDLKIRTVMAYNKLCEFQNETCPILARFSNPNQVFSLPVPLGNFRLGNPAPGAPVSLLGPADNVSAMNNMAWTVSNFRNSHTP